MQGESEAALDPERDGDVGLKPAQRPCGAGDDENECDNPNCPSFVGKLKELVVRMLRHHLHRVVVVAEPWIVGRP